MARTITSSERAAISSLRSAHWIKLEVWDSTSTYLDYSTQLRNKDWVTSVSLSDNIDANAMSFSGALLRETAGLSLAPFMAASLLNQVGGSYATLLDLWRKFKLSFACMPQGYAPTGADWKEVVQGRVDTIDTGGEQISITGRSEEAILLDKWMDTERTYGSVGGIAMETVLQSMLDDNGTGVTLYCPVSPGYLMNVWTQPKGNLFPAMVAVAEKAGFKLRYRYDSAGTFRLTLFQPNRTATVADWTLGPSEYTAVPLNKIDLSGVRNFIKTRFIDATLGIQTVIYPHMVGTGTVTCVAGAATFSSSQAGVLQNGANVIIAGIAYTVSAFSGTTTCTLLSQLATGGVPTFGASAFTAHGTLSGAGLTTSLTRFGRRDMEIDLSFTSQVNTGTKAQGMTDAVGPDMEFPNLEQQFEAGALWFVQLHDYGRFLANGIHYDSDQLGGVTGISFEASQGRIKSTLDARGKPSGAYITWRNLSQRTVGSGVSTSTIPLTLRAKALTTTATQIVFRVAVADALPLTDIALTYAGTGVGTISPASPLTILKANVTSDIETTGTKDITVDRAAFGSGTGRITFTATASNRVTSTDSGEVPSLDRDTVELLCRAKVQTTTATQVVFRVAVADPVTGGSGNVTVTYTGTGVGAIAPASPQTLLSANITTDIDTTATVDITVNRAAFGSGTGRITFTSTRTGRAASTDSGDVPALDRDTQSITTRITRISETATQIVVRVEAITPNVAATATVNYDGGGLTVSPATGGTFAATTLFGTTGHIDYTITRDTQGGTPRRVAFTVTAPGSIDGTDGADVPSDSTRNRCRLKRSGFLSVATGTNTAVGFDTEDYDVGSLHDTATNNSRVVIPAGGGGVPWLFGALADWSNNADTTRRKTSLWKNGALLFDGALITAINGNSTISTCFWMDVPTAGDYYEMVVWNDAAVNVNLGIASNFTALSIW